MFLSVSVQSSRTSEQDIVAALQRFGKAEMRYISQKARSVWAVVEIEPDSAGENAIAKLSGKSLHGGYSGKITIKELREKWEPKGGSIWAAGGGLCSPR